MYRATGILKTNNNNSVDQPSGWPFGKCTIDERGKSRVAETPPEKKDRRAEKPLSISLVNDGGSELIDSER